MNNGKRRNRKKLIWIVLIVCLLGAGGGGAWYHKKQQRPPIVQTEKAMRRNITELVVANGKIQPVLQVVINPEVSGEIIDLPVKEGQLVKKGDLLVQIKQDNYKASSNSAEATYKFALGTRSQAEAELQKAELQFRQNADLAKSKLISASVLMDFKTTYEVCRLRLEN